MNCNYLEYNLDILEFYDHVGEDKSLKDILDDIDFNFVNKVLNSDDIKEIEDLDWYDVDDVIKNKNDFKKVKLIIDRFVKEDFNLSNWKITEIPAPNTYIVIPIILTPNRNINTFIEFTVENKEVRLFYNDDYKHVIYNMFEANTINEAINNFNMYPMNKDNLSTEEVRKVMGWDL